MAQPRKEEYKHNFVDGWQRKNTNKNSNMKFYNITSESVEIIGKCLEQCLCTRQYSYVAKLFAYISPLDRDFCMSPCIDKKIVEERFLASLTLATITVTTQHPYRKHLVNKA